MIVKITFTDHEPMLFGNSYKDWDMQAREFFRIYPDLLKTSVSLFVSEESWKGWGGLKWCGESFFQEELNREGCQQNDPNNKDPRIYADMAFHERKDLMDKFK